MHTNSGFTLIELLVVIAIIAILAAILFPVFVRVKEKARQTDCLSNVKQLMLSVKMYADDHDDLVPARWFDVTGLGDYTTFMDQIYPYMRNEDILECPSVAEPIFDDRSPLGLSTNYAPNDYHFTTYGYPAIDTDIGVFASPVQNRYYKFSEVPTPARTMYLGEPPYPDYQIRCPFCEGLVTVYNSIGDQHGEGSNVGFCDGHAKLVNRASVSAVAGTNAEIYRALIFWGHEFGGGYTRIDYE